MDASIQLADSPTPDDAASPALPRLRIEALDGLRGLAALYVVYFHLGALLKPIMDTMSAPWRVLNRLTDHGHEAVAIFIVLSGFVLMLPIVRNRPMRPTQYLRRRARRILKPYFAALMLVLLAGLAWRVIVPLFVSGPVEHTLPNPFVQNATFAGILSHFLLLQNLSRPWVLMVDSPMWTVATEWQIYFFFPLVLLPVWRRFGVLAAIVIAFALGMLPVVLHPNGAEIGTWCPWFLALFAVGMAAAQLSVTTQAASILNNRRFWGFATFIAFGCILLMEEALPGYWSSLGLWCKDLLSGAAISLLLVYLARCQLNSVARRPVTTRILESHQALQLGTVSYSLYLIHLPILQLVGVVLRNHLSGAPFVVAMFLLAPAAAIICSIIFHMGFERPEFIECCTRMIRGWNPQPSDLWGGAELAES